MADLRQDTSLKRPRTASRETRRRQLIEATIASIATEGLSGTTMAGVTSRAGLSIGTVSFHFESKENLMKETLLYLVAEHRDFWRDRADEPGLSAAERLRAVIEANFQPEICTPDRIAVWFAFFGEARYREAYRKRVSHFDGERNAFVEAACAEIVAEGGYRGVEPKEIALALECFSDGLWLSLMLYPDWQSPPEAKKRITDYLARVFPAHFPKVARWARQETR